MAISALRFSSGSHIGHPETALAVSCLHKLLQEDIASE